MTTTQSTRERDTAMKPPAFDIAIGGGGLAGRMMALALATSLNDELDVAVLDPYPPQDLAADDPRCTSIAVGSKRFLEAIGVWDAVADAAQPVVGIRLTDSPLNSAVRATRLDWDNRIHDGFDDVDGDDAEVDAETAASFIVPNRVLAKAVTQAATARASIRDIRFAIDDASPVRSQLRLSAAASSPLRDEPDGAASPAVIDTRLLIGADGARSRLRKRAGIRTISGAHRQSAIVAVVSHDMPHDGIAVQHFLPGGPFAVLPLPHNRSCITWSDTTRDAERICRLDDAAFLSEIETRLGGYLGELSLFGDRRTFPIATQVATDFVANRFALIGDAAHSVHPIAGQGLNLAIRDIAALTECIADAMRRGEDAGSTAVLTRYSRWRRLDTVMSAGTFAGLNRLFSNDNALLRAARGAGMAMVGRSDWLKSRLVDEAAGLSGNPPKLLRGEMV